MGLRSGLLVHPRLPAAGASPALSKSRPFNETHWDDPAFNKVFDKVRGIPEVEKRRDGEHELQKMLYDEGGYIVWGFANQVDAFQKYVGGLVKNATGRPLGGWRFDRVWIGKV